MQAHLLHSVVEDSHQPQVPPYPERVAPVLRRHRVIRLSHLDMPIPMHDPFPFMEEREPLHWQRLQGPTLHFLKELADLLADRAVNTGVGHRGFPVEEMFILLLQARETVALQPILLDIIDAAFDLPLVPRRARLRGQDHATVMLTERLDLGIQVRVVPVGLLDPRLEIVDYQDLGHAGKMPKGVLDAANEVLGRLAVDCFAVALAAVRKHDAKDVRPPPTAVGQLDPCAGAKIDLRLLARGTLHATEW